ncbi:MAG: TetR family transcriptional regulator [Burkholderiaceae bacterium]
MVRRTKADAEATRNSLLDAAELLFQARGVSRTSLNDIALAAGTTRGAIYWHFKDKADLFNAMMERVTLPFEESLACVGDHATELDDPLAELQASMLAALHTTATNPQVRRVFEVATLQVEYNEEMRAVRERHLEVRNQCVSRTAKGLAAAAKKQALKLPIPLQDAALGLHVMVDGLIHNWLLHPEAFDLQASGMHTLAAYLRGLGFTLSAAQAPRLRALVPSKAGEGATPPEPTGLPTPAPSQKQTK